MSFGGNDVCVPKGDFKQHLIVKVNAKTDYTLVYGKEEISGFNRGRYKRRKRN